MATPIQEAIETFISITGASEAIAVLKLQDDMMDIDEPIGVGIREPPFSVLPSARNINPFSLLNPDLHRSLFDNGPYFTDHSPFVSHPREVREIPIGVNDRGELFGHVPTIENVIGIAHDHGPKVQGTVVVDEQSLVCST